MERVSIIVVNASFRLPAPGIPRDWSILTVYVNTYVNQLASRAELNKLDVRVKPYYTVQIHILTFLSFFFFFLSLSFDTRNGFLEVGGVASGLRQPRRQSSSAISDVASPVKLVDRARFQASSGNLDSANWPGYEAGTEVFKNIVTGFSLLSSRLLLVPRIFAACPFSLDCADRESGTG